MANSVLSLLPVDSLIKAMVVDERRTLSEVSRALKEACPHISKGLSERSIQRYCAANGIHGTSRVKDCVLCLLAWKRYDLHCIVSFISPCIINR